MANPFSLQKLLAGTAVGLSLMAAACATSGASTTPSPVDAQPVAQAEQAALPRTVILISIDGFRPDYLSRGITPNLSRLAQEGAWGPMKPSFPTVTFPNHYTLVTGLHPDHHGIVGNNMVDAELGSFSLGNKAAVSDRRWWDDGEPIWVTAEEQGVVTGTMFWPGSEADIRGVRPTHWAPFDQSMSAERRVDTLLSWFDLPEGQKPRLGTLYFDLVDTMGHHHGPNSEQAADAIKSTDAAIGYLLDGLKARGMDKDTVLLVVSDHGMADVSPERVTYLDDLVAADKFRVVYSGPVGFINATEGNKAELVQALEGKHPHMECWAKENIPARLVLGSHRRVTDVVCMSEANWVIATRARPMTRAGGAHGFDNESPDMSAIFIAHGANMVQGRRLENLDSVDVQPLLGRLLGIEVPATDGNPADTLPVTQN